MDKLFLKGFEYSKIKKFKQAEQYLKRCIAKNKNHFDALHLLAIIYSKNGKSSLAINYFQRAYAIKSNIIELNQNFVEHLYIHKEINSCLSLVDKMLISFPNDIKLLTIKARVLLIQENYTHTLNIFDSLFSKTKNPVFLLEQAKCESVRNNWNKAFAKAKAALDLSPFNPEICDFYVECLLNSRRYAELIEFCLRNHHHFSQINKKRIFHLAFDALNFINKEDVENRFKALNKISPIVLDEMINLHINSKRSPVFSSNQDIDDYRERYLSAIEKTNKHKIYFPCKQFRPQSHFYLSYNGKNNRELNQKLASLYPIQNDIKLNTNTRAKKKLLVVSDKLYDNHTISKLNIGLLDCLSKGVFDVTVWIPSEDGHVLINNIKKSVNKLKVVSTDIELLILNIKNIKPDFIFYPEIGMSNLIYCLANERLAPIQFTSWGHPETTGIKNIDYYLSSHNLEPQSANEHYSEKLLNLTQLPSVYTRIERPVKLNRHLQNLIPKNKFITCLQSAFKFHPDFDEILKAILEQNPEINLYMIASHSIELLMARFKKNGIHTDRIVILPKMTTNDFLNFYFKSTVALDPIHFGGGNTVYEGISLEVPIVTLPGEFMRGRVTLGAYKQIGFDKLVARSKEHYVELVNKLIQDECFNKQVRHELGNKSQKLFDTKLVAEELENKLIGLLENVK